MPWPPPPKIVFSGGAYILAKGIALGGIVVAVVHSGLSPFAQALIIAVVSALIGALGVITAALLTVIITGRLEHSQNETRKAVEDVKRAVGADNREGDPGDNHSQ